MIMLPLLMFFLSIGNYSRLNGKECIRPIHEVSLLAIGGLLTLVIVGVVRYFKAGRAA